MEETVSFVRASVTVGSDVDEEKNTIDQRIRVHRMHYVDGISKTRIAELTGLSKQFVIDWTRSEIQDLEADQRGWPMGQGRVWNETTRRRIRKIHRTLERDVHEFYSGATAIAQRYRQDYPDEPVPPLRTIGRMLKELGLSQGPKKRVKGAARYLCYPEYTVYETLGARVLEADFIGQKYLAGRTAPLHFVGMSFKQFPKLRHFYRVEAATTDALIDVCQDFFKRFEIPDVMKVDNAQATIGTGSGQRPRDQDIH